MTDWNSAQYLKFKAQRTQPAIDLAARIEADAPSRVLDIGCGPGNSTQVLYNRFPKAYILGIDNSQNMIDTAKSTYPNLDFMLCDVKNGLTELSGSFDVVFSNACIQWIPDHPTLLRNMMALLAPGGVLAVQIPMNYEEPIHQIITKTASCPPWADKLSCLRTFYCLRQGEYFDLLSEISSDFAIWQTTYFHKMISHQDILEWYRATGLRPYLNALTAHDRPAFEKVIYHALIRAYPKQKNGEIIFRFPRFFFTARK